MQWRNSAVESCCHSLFMKEWLLSSITSVDATKVHLFTDMPNFVLFKNTNLGGVRNHFKLEIRSFVMNFNSGGFSLRVLYCVVDTGYGLGRSLGDCRPALPKGQKYQMVKTQTESQDRRPIV